MSSNVTKLSTNEIASRLHSSLQRFGKLAKVPTTTLIEINDDDQSERNNDDDQTIQQLYNEVTRNDINKWNEISNCNDYH